MTIVLTGGGSGGHITPVLAVAAELKRLQPESRIVYIGQIGDNLGDKVRQNPNIDQTFFIRAGKFRRFHGEGFKQVFDLPTLYKNIRDIFYVIIGCWQSWRIEGEIKPDVVFSRGGYVSVPVAFGAWMRGVPYITHDSDPIPSLANRIIARGAIRHAVALPKDIYPYPPQKTITTGIPLNDKFVPVDSKLQDKYRKDLDIPTAAKLLFVVGGGLGSQGVNQAVAAVVPHLLGEFRDLYIIHGVGLTNEESMKADYQAQLTDEQQGRIKVYGFIDELYRCSGAADLIITRAGATNLAEFAIQGKACIVIPSSFLVGGHQIKNAQYLAEQGAAIVLSEDDLLADPNRLAKQISSLLNNKNGQLRLGEKLASFAKAGAAKTIATLIIEIGSEHEAQTP